MILGGQPAPAGLTLATQCPSLPQGGNEAIANWLDRNPDTRMVVIDVFAKMRGVSPPGASAYYADYAAVGHAKRLADQYGIAIVLVHHVRKAGSDDFLTEVFQSVSLIKQPDPTVAEEDRPVPYRPRVDTPRARLGKSVDRQLAQPTVHGHQRPRRRGLVLEPQIPVDQDRHLLGDQRFVFEPPRLPVLRREEDQFHGRRA
ncbi:AAA family ATPase [Streptomyces lydicus]|uniref:AAA family ATPase n=1 Tax=Streptomyces lydicus TaxID=47763 RepID=UPI0037AFC5EF